MAEKESGEDILRTILEKGSDKAKKDAADVLSSLDSAPVEAKTKRKRALGDLVGKIGKSTYFKKTDGTIVDDTGKPVSDRLQEAFHSNADVKTGMPKAPTKLGVQKNKQFELSLQKTIVSAKKVADTSELIYNKMPAVTDQLTSVANTLYEQNQNTIRNLIRKNEEFRDTVVEQLTGVKGPTKAGGAVSRPRKPSAVPTVSGSKVAKAAETQTRIAKATSFRTTRPAEVQARAGRIGAIRARRNVAMGAATIVGGAAIGAGAIIAATKMGGGPSAPPAGGPGGGPAAPGPTGTQPSAGAQRSSTPGMVTLTTPISKRQYVVAEQYANNFKGFVDELENSGYQIKSIGGYANRNIAGTGQKSFHALGVSIDINPSSNPHLFDGRTVTDMPSNVSAMARKYGLGWGGDWRSSKDTMHFSMAEQEGGSVRIDRSGVAPLPGAPETPGTTAMAAAGATATPAPAGVAGGAPSLSSTQGAPAGAPTAAPPPPMPGVAPTVKDIAQYIVSKAQSMGVDPNLALGIAAYEGLNPNTIGSPTFGNKDAKGYSFGPYQLYSGSPDPTRIAPGGMAAEFMQKYGEPPSASNWHKQVDFSLELMKRRGPAGLERGPWYAVRDRGGVANITRLGAAYAAQQGVVPGEPVAPSAVPAPGAEAVPPGTPTPSLPSTQEAPAGAPTPAPSGPATGTGGVGTLAGPGGQENVAGSPPSNISLGPNVDLSKVDPDLLQRFYKAASEFGGPVRINSAYRGDEYQAQLWVRANIFKEPGIFSPAKPKETTTITYKGQQYTVPGSGKGSSHAQGRALDVSPAEALDPFLKKYGLNRPFASFDPPHVMKIGGEPFDAESGSQVAGGPQRSSAPAPTGGANPQQQAAAPPRPAPPTPRAGPQPSMMPQQQMAAMSQQNAMQDFFSAMMGMQQPVIMNNTRMINNTRTVFQQPSYVPSRGRMEDVNPLVVAGAAAGFGIARALRIF